MAFPSTAHPQRALQSLSLSKAAGLFAMAVLYLWAGAADKLFEWQATVGYVASRGLPFPALLAALALLTEVVAPLSLLVPRLRAPAALLLAVYTLATALLFHDFWHPGPDATNMLQHFLKNLALTGAWLYVFADTLQASRASGRTPAASPLAGASRS